MQTDSYSVLTNEWGQQYILADGRIVPIVAGGTPDEPADDGSEGDAGGGGKEADEGAEGDDDKTPDEGDEGDGDDKSKERAASGKGEKKERTVPYSRFSKVNGERQAWRKLGSSPEEVAQRLARAERIERAARGEREVDPEDESMDRASEALGRVIDRRYGRGADEDFQAFREARNMQALHHAKQGLNYLRETLEDHNIPFSDETFEDWEVRVGDEMARDPKLHAKFKNPVTQEAAVQDAFGRLRDRVINPALAAQGAAKLQAGRRRHAAALSSPRAAMPAGLDGPLAPPKDMTDPVARANWWKDTAAKTWDDLSQNE